jgi:hypothetical protein
MLETPHGMPVIFIFAGLFLARERSYEENRIFIVRTLG